MGDGSFVEVKPIDLTDEGVARTAFGAMMELGQVIVPNKRYTFVTPCNVSDASPICVQLLWISLSRCAIVRDFFHTLSCILQWPSYADPASTVDSLVSVARIGVVSVIRFSFCNLGEWARRSWRTPQWSLRWYIRMFRTHDSSGMDNLLLGRRKGAVFGKLISRSDVQKIYPIMVGRCWQVSEKKLKGIVSCQNDVYDGGRLNHVYCMRWSRT